jgi:hypothetical protein
MHWIRHRSSCPCGVSVVLYRNVYYCNMNVVHCGKNVGRHGGLCTNTHSIYLYTCRRVSILCMQKDRGKRSVGLGLSNREIAELRYQGLYQVVDLSKSFFFSYTYGTFYRYALFCYYHFIISYTHASFFVS